MNYPKQSKVLLAWILLAFALFAAFSLIDNNVIALDSLANSSIGSSLAIWDNEIEGLPVNSTAIFYANYSFENGSIAGIDVCRIKIESDNTFMSLNTTSGLYFYSRLFSVPGNYTYSVNCTAVGYENEELVSSIKILLQNTSQENNQINNVDNDNDSYTNDTDCNDNNPLINPGREETHYNSIDDDCNLATLDYIIFDIKTNKQSYNPGETVEILINGTKSSDTYITINTPTNISYVYIFANGTYPVIQQFSLTQLAGPYSIEGINYLGSFTNSKDAAFSVSNTFDASIQTSTDNAHDNENIHFKATFTGAIGNVNMIWNMDDGTEKYTSEFDYSYSSPKEYNIVLIATDQGGNQIVKSKKIIVTKKYFLAVKVEDNSTNEIIEDAQITLDSLSKDANESGMAEFTVTNKTYELEVEADNYNKYGAELKINNSLIFIVKLVKKQESIAPLITLISPANNSIVSSPEMKYKFDDDSKATCTIFASESNDWWLELNTTSGLESGIEHTFNPELNIGSYKWRVRCRDEDNNIAYSKDFNFTVSAEIQAKEAQTQAASENPGVTYNIIENVYELIPDFGTYSPDEKKIVELLDLEFLLKDAKRKLEMANRDLFNLGKQPDTDSVIKTRDEIYSRIDAIKDETPQSVSINKKVDFVKYVDDEDLEPLFEEYLTLKKAELSKNEKKKLLETNKLLQKKATIETAAYNVDITYISGRAQAITLIVRSLEISSLSADTMYVEFVPKEISESAENINFITKDASVLNKDPVFEVSAKQITQFIYYLDRLVSLDEIPKIKTVLLTLSPDEKTQSQITGLSIFDSFGFSEPNKKIFIIEILVVFILLGVYLFYYFKSRQNEPLFVSEKTPESKEIYLKPPLKAQAYPLLELSEQTTLEQDDHKLDYIRKVIAKAKTSFRTGKIQDAAMAYYEIKFLYGLLDEKNKKVLFNEIISLSDNLAMKNIDTLVDEAIIEMAKSNSQRALEIYEEIKTEFSKLSDECKEKLYPRCCELALHLRQIPGNDNTE